MCMWPDHMCLWPHVGSEGSVSMHAPAIKGMADEGGCIITGAIHLWAGVVSGTTDAESCFNLPQKRGVCASSACTAQGIRETWSTVLLEGNAAHDATIPAGHKGISWSRACAHLGRLEECASPWSSRILHSTLLRRLACSCRPCLWM